MTAAISIRNLGKCYRVAPSEARRGYRTLRESLVRAASAPVRRLRGETTGASKDFWALNGITFDVQPGEVVGIIGCNGAGKSTLLKILSQITKPTTGEVEVSGRISSLLEVGTGFHPELTGTENIYLNGAILGMSRREIRRNFDAIVGFAEVERFLNVPVKRYSSGMYVRLAFAVAAHLEPEILVIDEVLAVGDMAFQRKCLGRMRAVSEGGRTVLFVSHNMAAVQSICTTGVLLDRGKVAASGPVPEIINAYCGNSAHVSRCRYMADIDSASLPAKPVSIHSAELVDNDGHSIQYVASGKCVRIRLTIRAHHKVQYPTIGVAFDDSLEQRLLTVHTPLHGDTVSAIDGLTVVECEIPQFPLAPGDYSVKLALGANGDQIDVVERAFVLRIVDGDAFGDGRAHTRGVCIARSQWRLVESPAHAA